MTIRVLLADDHALMREGLRALLATAPGIEVVGKTSIEIGHMIHLAPSSVQTYRSRLMMKLGVSDVPSLVKFALEHGLTPP